MNNASTSPELLSLSAGETVLQICPAVGGAIAQLRHAGFDLLRPLTAAQLENGNVRDFACYPLLPYSNRIADGRFSWLGKTYQLDRNFGDHPHSIHGNAWQRAWQVAAQQSDAITLTLQHSPNRDGARAWPFAYLATQTFTLSKNTLQLRLSVTNEESHSVPMGLGWHPYFSKTPDCRLQFAADTVWLNGTDQLPSEIVPVPSRWSFPTTRKLQGLDVDNCFLNWHRRAEIAWPESAVRVTIKASSLLHHLVLFTGDDKAFIAVEPVSHRNDAINSPSADTLAGMCVLPAGATLTAELSLQIADLDA